jgi:hypothetical protein
MEMWWLALSNHAVRFDTSIGILTSQIAAAGLSRQLDYQVETKNEGIPVRSGGVSMSAGR